MTGPRREDAANGKSRPLACRLGWHSWFLDCAMFTSAERCAGCGSFKDKYAGQRLDLERMAWEEATNEEERPLTQDEQMAYVARRVLGDDFGRHIADGAAE